MVDSIFSPTTYFPQAACVIGRVRARETTALSSRDPRKLWDAVLGDLQVQVARPSYDTFLKQTVGISVDGECLVVAAPTAFVAEYLQKRMRGVVQRAVERVARVPLDVRFEVVVAAAQAATAPEAEAAAEAAPMPAPKVVGPGAAQLALDPRYVFERFTVGTSNEMAVAAARVAAEAPGEKYNPVFLYSPPGLGKTHLLHAIGHRARERGLQALYVSSDRFVTEFVTSIREGKAAEFRERYRRPDVLLMDDVQFLSGKEQTQEGLFHIFNELHHSGRQVVLACDRPPRALKPLDDRLRSRFEWGLTADIQPPDLETRMAILRAKAASLGAAVPDDVLEALARREYRSVRELEGNLNRLSAYADLTGRPVTMELVQQALGVLEEAPEPVVHTAEGVIEQAARLFGTTAAGLRSPKRERTVSHARHLAMYVMREDMGLALTEIGRALGGRDHSTVFQAVAKVASRLRADATLQRDVAALRARLGSRAA